MFTRAGHGWTCARTVWLVNTALNTRTCFELIYFSSRWWDLAPTQAIWNVIFNISGHPIKFLSTFSYSISILLIVLSTKVANFFLPSLLLMSLVFLHRFLLSIESSFSTMAHFQGIGGNVVGQVVKAGSQNQPRPLTVSTQCHVNETLPTDAISARMASSVFGTQPWHCITWSTTGNMRASPSRREEDGYHPRRFFSSRSLKLFNQEWSCTDFFCVPVACRRPHVQWRSLRTASLGKMNEAQAQGGSHSSDQSFSTGPMSTWAPRK